MEYYVNPPGSYSPGFHFPEENYWFSTIQLLHHMHDPKQWVQGFPSRSNLQDTRIDIPTFIYEYLT